MPERWHERSKTVTDIHSPEKSKAM